MDKLFHSLIKENILLNTGDIYGFNKNSAFRLSYSYLDKKDIEKSVKKISKIIKEIK